MKNILIAVVVLAVLGGGAYWYSQKAPLEGEIQTSEGKLKAVLFTGTLEESNEACFADGECYVVVAGKHVTTVMGWSQETVGSIFGKNGLSLSIGEMSEHIGEMVEVYAQDKGDGTYTLYGSEGFYVKLK